MSVELLKQIDRVLIGESADISRYDQLSFEDRVKPSGSWAKDLHDWLFGERKSVGQRLMFDDSGERLRLRPGELTVWSGYNKHGKSLVLNQVMLGLVRSGSKVVIASLELQPLETLSRMVCQASAVHRDRITPEGVEDVMSHIEDMLWLYSETGDMEPKRVIALSRYVRAELGADHLVIDSLMKCGTDDQDYAAEKRLVNSLQNVAKQSGLHIHLVAHGRKGKAETEIMNRFDIAGSAKISDLADNVVIVARNIDKEIERKKPQPDAVKMDKPDAWLVVDKQRHGSGWEGAIALWHHESGHFTNHKGRHFPIFG